LANAARIPVVGDLIAPAITFSDRSRQVRQFSTNVR
jgi:hypothetical protein